MSAGKHDPTMPPQNEQQWKKGLLLPKKSILIFSSIYDPVYSRETDRIVTKEQEVTKCLKKTK